MLSYLFILLTCAIINIWGQKVQTSVFYEAFFPITWIKPRAGITKYNKYMRSLATCDITMPRTVWMVCLCKNYHFQNEANCQTFLVKRNSVCMRIKKNHPYVNGFVLSLALKQRLVGTWKWPTCQVHSAKWHCCPKGPLVLHTKTTPLISQIRGHIGFVSVALAPNETLPSTYIVIMYCVIHSKYSSIFYPCLIIILHNQHSSSAVLAMQSWRKW